MATRVYKTGKILTVDDLEISVMPLKIKYIRDFMEEFELVKQYKGQDEELALKHLIECVRITMMQYYPDFKTTQHIEDNFDVNTLYEVLDYAADISVKTKTDSEIEKNPEASQKWSDFDLASLEAEAFILGIWKDYDELEQSMSLPELLKTIEIKRELDYAEKKFLAAIQGVDLDKQTGRKEENAWEKLKAKVFSGGKTEDPNDVLSLQGVNATKAGFGIGMGLDYEKIG